MYNMIFKLEDSFKTQTKTLIITGALKQVVSPKIGTLVLKTITDTQFGLATGGLVGFKTFTGEQVALQRS